MVRRGKGEPYESNTAFALPFRFRFSTREALHAQLVDPSL